MDSLAIYIKRLISTAFIMLLGLSLFAQDVEFNSLVTKKKVGKFEKFRIDFVINKNVDDIIPPSFSDFAYLGGPSTSVNQSWINGKSSYSKTYSYYMMPKGIGEFQIGPATAIVDGITYKTKPIKIIVLDQKQESDNPNDPENIASKNVSLTMELSSSKPYVNQQITISYYLYFKTNISTPSIVEVPKFNGFWSQDFEMPRSYQIEKKYLNDELYQRILLKKSVLIPQKSGKLKIEPFVLSVPVQISTGRLDFFGNPINRTYDYTVATPEKTVSVRALPQKGKPADFSGAVGNFDFDVKLSKKEVKANESITLKATVAGNGNLRLFTLPEFNLPDELEVYEPKYSEKVDLTTSGLNGRISNEYIIIPRYKGSYKLPDLSFSYFDPIKGKYKSFTNKDLKVEVISGEAPAINNTSGNIPVASKSKVELMAKDIRYIHNTAVFESYENNKVLGQLWYFALLLMPLILFPLILFIYSQKQKSRRDVVGRNRRKAAKIAKKIMGDAKKALDNGDTSLFYQALSKAIYRYISLKFNLNQAELSRDNINEILSSKAVKEESIKKLMSIIDSCEMAKYAPVSSLSPMKELYDDTIDIISEIEKVKS